MITPQVALQEVIQQAATDPSPAVDVLARLGVPVTDPLKELLGETTIAGFTTEQVGAFTDKIVGTREGWDLIRNAQRRLEEEQEWRDAVMQREGRLHFDPGDPDPWISRGDGGRRSRDW